MTAGNKEIYLEDAEALEFLWKKDDKSTEEVDGHNDDRDERAGTRSLFALNSSFAETFASEWGARITGVQMGKRGGG